MDSKDKLILDMLKKNSKMTIKEISQSTHLSPTPVYERIKKMENDGVIEAYTIRVDPVKIGKKLFVFCQLSLEIHHKDVIEKFEKNIVEFEEVIACYHLAGIMDYLLYIGVEDMGDYQEFLKNKLASMENIRKVQSSFVLTEVKKEL